MNTRHIIHYNTDESCAVVLDRFPRQKVCGRIHKLNRIQTTMLMVDKKYRVPGEPSNPYPAA